MDYYDVIVIGAGPAGTSSALFLRKAGYRVLLLDQAGFPRDKVCGEFVSPAVDALLDELGVLASIEALSPVRLNGVVLSSYEENEVSIDYPDGLGHSGRMTSLSLPRTLFDSLMLAQARKTGVDIREHHKVDDLIFENGSVVGVRGGDARKSRFEFRAKVVVDAGGRNSISIRRLNLKKNANGACKIALAAHWSDVSLPQRRCYMHVSRPGYTGISQVGDRLANVVLIVDRSLLKGEDPQAFYLSALFKNRKRSALLDRGVIAEKPRTVESLAFSVKPVPCGGLLLVGDAMGFIDPFTGEGIYLALKSSQIAAGVIHKALEETGGFTKAHLNFYERLRHTEFNKKFLLSRVLQFLIYKPQACNWVVKVLLRNPSLAAMLVGAIGDYLPAGDVASATFLMRMIAGSWFPQDRAQSDFMPGSEKKRSRN